MYSAAVSSSRLPVTTMTGVSGASRSPIRSASAALNVGSEWSVRMMSGAKVRSASRYARSESTRRVAPMMPARRSSRSTSAASSATSSTIRTRTRSGISSARLLVQQQPVEPDLVHGAPEGLEIHRLREIPGLEGAQGELHVARVVLDQQDLDLRMPGHAITRRGRMEENRGMHTY